MEYRRRRRTAYRPRHAGAYPAYVAMAVVFLGVVYLVGASKASTWFAGNVIAPLIRSAAPASPTPTAAPTQTPDAGTAERSVVLEGRTCYALQIGVYAERANAESQSDALRDIGAAGCIVEDGGRYRVLAAGYPEEASMQKVAAQLALDGIESRKYCLEAAERVIRISGTGAQLDAVEAAANGMPLLLETLYQTAIEFDRDKRSMADGQKTLETVLNAIAVQESGLDALESDGLSEIAQISGFYGAAGERVRALMGGQYEQNAAFSSALKRAYLETFADYVSYAGSNA